MRDRWQRWQTRIAVSTPIERQQAPLLQAAILALLVICTLLIPFAVNQPTAAGQLTGAVTVALTLAALGVALLALRKGGFHMAVNIAVGTMLGLMASRLATVGLDRNPAVLAAYAVPIALAGLLGRRATLLAVAAVSVGLVGGAAALTGAGGIAAFGDATSGEISRIMSTFIAVVLFLVIILDRFGGSLRTALLATLAREAELEQLRAGLEETVAARTAALTRALAAAEEARAAADHANQLKTRFLANMSHELRTPLNAILNFTDMVGLPRFGPLTEGQRELQQRVLASAEHLLGLINDILDLAKIEAGRMDLLYETVDLSALLRSMMSTAAGLTNDKGLQLILDVPDDLPPVRIDKTRIRQVLLNLLSNAAKFTEHGSITLQARILPDSLIEVAVVDTGIGIEPADHGMVFEEFRQVQDSNTRSYGGTGLGLPISRRLIEMHGGQMAMDSAPGRGSTFAFTLPMLIPLPPLPRPALEAALAGPLAQIPGPADGAQPLVVVVDDDPDAQAILGQQLTGAGYAIHPILDSRAALAAISAIQPRLVILDVQMPHVDGWAVLNQLRGDAATAAIPVMMCTIVDEQRQGVLLGASDYVLKPVRKDDFLGRVRRWLDQPAPVLVVDDDADARRIAREALESQGYAVREAANGAAALARLAESKPALIILDLMMPVMDGFEVLQWLDGHPDYQGIPVIVVSARDLTPDEAAWVRTRACEHLQKGQVTNDRLLRHIHHCIQAGQTPAA